MRWFCLAFGTLVVVSTALSQAGSPAEGSTSLMVTSAATFVPQPDGLSLDSAEASHFGQTGAWSITLLLGLPFLIRRRREHLN